MSPNDGELGYLSIREAANLIRARKLSPVELTAAVLDRIDRLDHLNAYITVTRDWAMALAKAAEEEIMKGNYRGPLHGIPIGLKDLYDTAGVLTTAGSKVLANNIPNTHATVVARTLEAGAVIVGKQNMHEFAAGFSGVNPHFGTPLNPWDTDHLAGGSSGGTAAALAAGLCLGGMGSDSAGSIRVPSSFCGLTGLKPTYGRVSVKGVVPLSWTLDHSGPMARSVEDCALLLNAIAGYDPDDIFSVNTPIEDYTATLERGISGLRIGVITDYLENPGLDAEVKDVVQTGIKVLEKLGATIEELRLPGLEELRQAYHAIIFAERFAYHTQWIESRAEGYGADFVERTQSRAADISVPQLAEAYRHRTAAIRSFALLMESYDLLVGPTTPFTAPAIIDGLPVIPDSRLYGLFTGPFNVAGLPALSLPCGFNTQGLPIGMMIVGRHWGEATVLRAGAAYQSVTDWHRRRPDLRDAMRSEL